MVFLQVIETLTKTKVDEANLQLTEIFRTPASQVLGLKVYKARK